MPTDTLTDAAPEATLPVADSALTVAPADRLPHPPRARRFVVSAPKPLRRSLRSMGRALTRAVDYLARDPHRRRRSAVLGALAVNAGILVILAIYGRVYIFVPNKPANSISVVYVDLPASPPVIDFRDPELAPKPEPEPIIEPELTPEVEPEPVPEPEPPAEAPEPEPEPKPAPEPIIDFTPEPVFAPPSEIDEAPLIPDLDAAPAIATVDEPLPGDIVVEGEQTPTEDAPPLLAVEPEERQAQKDEDAGDEEEQGDEAGAGDVAAGEQETIERPSVASARPSPDPSVAGDDQFDEEPVFNGRRLALPSVDLPTGEASAVPGTSGVVAIFCPDEFKDKEKIAECAGRPEIRSGWRPGSSGEDFSKAAAVLKAKRKHGDFSNDETTFGPEIARQLERRRRVEDLEDARKSQSDVIGAHAGASDPAAGTRPDFGGADAEPGWTRRDDPLVDQKDIEKLRKELEEAERRKSPE